MKDLIIKAIANHIDKALWKTIKNNQEFIAIQDEQIAAQVTTINDLLEEVQMKANVIENLMFDLSLLNCELENKKQ